jgi:hypothetical protein
VIKYEHPCFLGGRWTAKLSDKEMRRSSFAGSERVLKPSRVGSNFTTRSVKIVGNLLVCRKEKAAFIMNAVKVFKAN